MRLLTLILPILFLLACQPLPPTVYDVLITHATIYDGRNSPPIQGMLAINADTIAAIGTLDNVVGKQTIDAAGMAVSPGFINMLSWATESLIEDGRGMSDLKQGITLEVMGEGQSMGPLSPLMRKGQQEWQGEIQFDITWTTLGEYLAFLEEKGVSPNVASFVGATTLRIHQVGLGDREPTSAELDSMKILVKEAMEEGAMGIASALIYAPAFYAQTEELIELCKVASEYDGLYITHMRSEGNRLLEGIDEVIRIAHEASINAEIYHLKASGRDNWPKLDLAIQKIDSARAAGIQLSTDMYTYIAGATGLDAAMPPWVQAGGYAAWAKRLKDPNIRWRVKQEMMESADDWENLYHAAGSTDNLLFVGFNNPKLRQYTGKTLTEVSRLRETDPEDTIIDLVIEDGSRVGTVYFLMSEENVKKQMRLPYMSFCSDASAPAAEGMFLNASTHPRAYGNFARLLGKYVRDEQVISLQEAIHKLTGLPATHLKLQKRGFLKKGSYADVVIFDPDSIQDHATFDKPHQYSTGVQQVFVNGIQVIQDGEHTGATPGRVVRGPGWTEKK